MIILPACQPEPASPLNRKLSERFCLFFGGRGTAGGGGRGRGRGRGGSDRQDYPASLCFFDALFVSRSLCVPRPRRCHPPPCLNNLPPARRLPGPGSQLSLPNENGHVEGFRHFVSSLFEGRSPGRFAISPREKTYFEPSRRKMEEAARG